MQPQQLVVFTHERVDVPGGSMSHKILLIQDDPSDATTIREALLNSTDGSFQVEWVRCCSEGLERLTRTGGHKTDRLAAVLVDLHLPDSQGIETFDLLFRTAPQIPILVLCTLQDEHIGRWAVERG